MQGFCFFMALSRSTSTLLWRVSSFSGVAELVFKMAMILFKPDSALLFCRPMFSQVIKMPRMEVMLDKNA